MVVVPDDLAEWHLEGAERGAGARSALGGSEGLTGWSLKVGKTRSRRPAGETRTSCGCEIDGPRILRTSLVLSLASLVCVCVAYVWFSMSLPRFGFSVTCMVLPLSTCVLFFRFPMFFRVLFAFPQLFD